MSFQTLLALIQKLVQNIQTEIVELKSLANVWFPGGRAKQNLWHALLGSNKANQQMMKLRNGTWSPFWTARVFETWAV